MPELIQNAIYIPEADKYLVSTHRHDFQTHTFDDGSEISVDGGSGPDSYARRVGGNKKGESAGAFRTLSEINRYEERIITDEDNIDHIRDNLLWGTRGKNGDQPLTFRPIKELALRKGGADHMKAILRDVGEFMHPIRKQVIEYWLKEAEAVTDKNVNWT
jgi:hypothetical protein